MGLNSATFSGKEQRGTLNFGEGGPKVRKCMHAPACYAMLRVAITHSFLC